MRKRGRVAYTYDEFDRITGISVDGSVNPCYTYEYGANGRAARVTDANLGRTLETEYDLADRPCRSTLKDTNGNIVYRSTLCYDILSNPVQLREDVNGSHVTDFTYDRDNRVTRAQFASNANCRVDNTFDALGRLSNRTATNGAAYATTYSYVGGGYGTNSTTPMVSGITQTGMNFAYAYDSRGNITSETRNGSTTTYVYDGIGQLVRMNDPHENVTWVYNYDRGGNITSKVKYAYTTGIPGAAVQTISYSYDSTWKDKLVSYNGNSIIYDAIGNPLSDGTWTYTWERGRQLKQLSKSGTTIQFKYDHNGIRTQKIVTVNGTTTTTNYIYSGKKLVHLTQGNNWLHFYYDGQSPAMVNYNGTLYTYIKNLQGDIVGILSNAGSLVVEYKYDAWGRHLSTTGSMAGTLGALNPFRYRGYVYDAEIGCYYLINRLYAPNICRFVVIDTIINGHFTSLYSYCKNSPVIYCDNDGNRPQLMPQNRVHYVKDLEGAFVVRKYPYFPNTVLRAAPETASDEITKIMNVMLSNRGFQRVENEDITKVKDNIYVCNTRVYYNLGDRKNSNKNVRITFVVNDNTTNISVSSVSDFILEMIGGGLEYLSGYPMLENKTSDRLEFAANIIDIIGEKIELDDTPYSFPSIDVINVEYYDWD